MAKDDKTSPKEQKSVAVQTASGGGRDRLITGLLGVAAAIAVLTLGVLATRFSGSQPSGTDQLLRLASSQFVEGEIVVAGKLAETIDLGEEDPLPPDITMMSESEVADSVPEDSFGERSGDESEEPSERSAPRVLQQFLIGMGKIHQAKLATDSRKIRSLRTEGVEALAASRRKGFPLGRDVIGNRTLGETLIRLGRYNEAVDPLAMALSMDPTIRRELLPKYATALRRSTPPRPEETLASIKEFLFMPTLPVADRSIGRGIELNALVDTGRYSQAEEKIEEIRLEIEDVAVTREPAELELHQLAKLLAGKILVQKIEAKLKQANDSSVAGDDQASMRFSGGPKGLNDPEVAGLIRSAITTLSEVVRTAAPSDAIAARLVMSRLYQLIGDDDRALIQLTDARQQRPLTSIAALAGVEEMELLGKIGDGEGLTQSVRYLVREIEDPTGFDETEISLDEFRRRTVLAIGKLHKSGQFEYAILASAALPPVFGKSDSLIGQGRAYAAWAAATESVGRGLTPDRQTAALARSRYRAAGAALATAAEELFGTSSYVETQWSAIEAYQNGRHFRESIRLLEPYLRYVDRRRSSRGLLAMGRALLTEGRAEEAIDVLSTCLVEQPRDALRYDARLWIAKAFRELGQSEEAKRFLLENLRDGSLTPQSPAWRDSLFAMGETMQAEIIRPLLATHTFDAAALPPGPKRTEYREQIDQTLRYFDEAIQRYWPSPQSLSAIYESAATDRAAAKLDRIEAGETEMLEAAQRVLRNRSDSHLRSANAKMQRLAGHLISLEDERRLTSIEKNLLRNSLMLQGDLLAEMKNYHEASEAYRIVEQRHVHTPTALEAIMRRREMLRQLGRRDEADLLVRQAQATLERIGSTLDAQFVQVSRYDRRGWEDYLGWLSGQLEQSS